MRACLTIACILILPDTGTTSADEPPRADQPTKMAVHALLREASEIALKQGKQERFWIDRVLLHIGEVQIRAGDLDGALRSFRGSNYDYGRESGLVQLVEAFTRIGDKDRALEVSRLVKGFGWTQDHLRDLVAAQWVEHELAMGDLKLAEKAIEQVKSNQYRREGMQKLAAAYARSSDAGRAEKCFAQAIDAASGLKVEYDRARALWEIADAQRLAEAPNAARETMRRLVGEAGRFKDAWAKASALREAAVLAAKLNDGKAAHTLFRGAIEARQGIDDRNKMGSLEYIAAAQASVGFIDDARKIAAMIKHDDKDFTIDGYRERVLYAIAVAQVKAGDAQGAVATALSIEHFVQYRDDALNVIVARHIGKQDLKAALAATDKFKNPLRQAAAILKVATAQAKAGDRKAAADIAGKIKLTHRSRLMAVGGEKGFDYRRPQSWGDSYDSDDFFTMASQMRAERRAAEVAAAAMALAQVMQLMTAQSYAVLLDDNLCEVTQALARTHAAVGDANEAIVWAKKIGSGDEVDPKNRDRSAYAVERRIHALIGAAEGILDRLSKAPQE